MKKTCVILILLILAGSVWASSQIRTSVSPYSFQRFASKSETKMDFDSDYGFGIRFAYLAKSNIGVTFAVEFGAMTFLLPDESPAGNITNFPVLAKLGYFSTRSKKINFYILGEIGVNIKNYKDVMNTNFATGIELGLSQNLKNGFSLNYAIEPLLSFSKEGNEEYTDFMVAGHLGLGYEF